MENKSLITALQRITWKEDPVVTTAQLAEFYECSVDNIRRNFSNNRDRFVDGKHFFKIEGDDLQRYRKTFPVPLDKFAPSLFLWTKRGAARHAKMLNTDRAWEVFELLEDNYFDRPAVAPVNPLSEIAAIEREKLALEREKFNVANSEETKTFAKAQLLRDIASSSRDDVLRDKLIREATKMLMGDDFFKDEFDDMRIIRC